MSSAKSWNETGMKLLAHMPDYFAFISLCTSCFLFVASTGVVLLLCSMF